MVDTLAGDAKPQGVIEVAPKMTEEWFDDSQIVVYTMGTSERLYFDVILERVTTNMRNWPKDRPYLAIYELAQTNIMITPHVREGFHSLMNEFPDLTGRFAAVLPGTGASHAIRLFLMARTKQGARERKIFHNREKALEWLREALKA